MITIILIIAAIVAIGIYIFSLGELTKTEGQIIKSIAVLALASLIVSIGVTNTQETRFKTPLVNLKDKTFISGHVSMILGSGSGEVKEEFKYTMYYKTKSGAKLIQLPVNDCTIIYTKSTPCLETISEKVIYPGGWRDLFIISCVSPSRYNIYIPAGAIDGEFKLDAE